MSRLINCTIIILPGKESKGTSNRIENVEDESIEKKYENVG